MSWPGIFLGRHKISVVQVQIPVDFQPVFHQTSTLLIAITTWGLRTYGPNLNGRPRSVNWDQFSKSIEFDVDLEFNPMSF